MKPVLIITRPAPDGARFAEQVRDALDVAVILSPLLEIVPMEAKCEADEFIFTSTNGVAQAARLGLRGGRAWCVGDRTAEMARLAGFDAVSAQGDAEAVLAMVLADAPHGKLAHVRGKEARGNIGSRLRSAGIDCADVIAYEQRAVPLNEAARLAIAGPDRVVIPLFSPRTAELLMGQVKIGKHAVLIAISDVVAKMVEGQNVKVTASPTGAAMLADVIAECRRIL